MNGATEYELQRSSNGRSWSGLAKATARQYTDRSGIRVGQTYHYRLRGRNAGGDGPWSDNVQVLVLGAARLSLAGKSGACQLAWTSVSGAASYKLWRHHQRTGRDQQVGGALTGTSYADNGVTVNDRYFYTLQAVTREGVSGPDSNRVECIPGAVVNPPTGKASVTARVESTGSVKLTWDAVNGATEYELQRSSNGRSWSGLAKATARQYTDRSGIRVGQTYHYRLRGRNAGGDGPWSDNVQVLVLGAARLSLAGKSGACQLAWTSVSGAASYKLWRHHQRTGRDQQVGGALTGTSYADNGVTVNDRYFYTLQAVTREGVSGPDSNRVECIPGAVVNPPTGKASVTARVESTGSVKLTWSAVNGATEYELQRSSNGRSWSGLAKATARQYTDRSGIRVGQTYHYRLRGRNAGGDGPWSDNVQVLVLGAARLSLAGKSGACQLAWTSVSGAASYKLWRHHQRTGRDQQVGGALTGTSYADNGVTVNDRYFYTLQAVTREGVSGPDSNRVECIPGAVVNPPTGKASVTARVESTGSVKLTWSAVNGATGYVLFRYDSAWSQVGDALTGTRYTDTGLAVGQTYYYAVAAVNAAGRGPWSDNVQVLVLGATRLSLAGKSGACQLEWTSVSGAASYKLWRHHQRTGRDQQVGGALTGTSYADNGVTVNDRYFYTLQAVTREGVSGPDSNRVECIPGAVVNPPTGKASVTARVESTGSVKLTWSAVNGATGYVLFRYDSAWSQVGDALTGTRYTDTGLAVGQTYYYAVAAVNAAGRGPWSDYAQVMLSPVSTDRDVLVTLYNATDGTNWTNDTYWLSDRPIGEWPGVTTDGNGRVTKLDLSHNGLGGTIPPQLGNLTELTYLRLSNNRLTGSIPSELGDLANLTHLYLFSNRLTGSIPSQLGNLANLTHLYLSNNRLTGSIPSQLGNLANLINLTLHSNQLSGTIPPQLGSLASLRFLHIEDNQLRGCVPAAWKNIATRNLGDLPFCIAKSTLVAQIATKTSVVLIWTDVGASSYELFRYDNGWEPIGGNLTKTTYTDTGLTAGKTYYYQMRGRHGSGAGPWSNRVLIIPDDDSKIPPAGRPTLIAWISGTRSVHIEWTNLDRAASYELERKDSGSWTHLAYSNGTTYIDSPLVAGITYNYRVRARNAAGNSDWSNTTKVRAGSAMTRPGKSTLFLKEMDNDSFTISWTTSPRALSYDLERCNNDYLYNIKHIYKLFSIVHVLKSLGGHGVGEAGLLVAEELGKEAVGPIAGILGAKALDYLDNSQISALSDDVEFNELVITGPTVVLFTVKYIVIPLIIEQIIKGTVNQISECLGWWDTIVEDTTETIYEVDHVESGQNNWYRVVAKNEAGDGEKSDILHVRGNAVALHVTDLTSTSVSLEWTPFENASRFDVLQCAISANDLANLYRLREQLLGYRTEEPLKLSQIVFAGRWVLGADIFCEERTHSKGTYAGSYDNLSTGMIYFYEVKSHSGFLERHKVYSNDVEVRPGMPFSAPKLTMAGKTANSVSLEWNSVPSATSYILFRTWEEGDNIIEKRMGGTLTGRVYTDNDSLISGKTYIYMIRARNDFGMGPWSAAVTVEIETPPLTPVPSAATQTPTPTAVVKPSTAPRLFVLAASPTSARVIWGYVDEADYYELYRWDNDDRVWIQVGGELTWTDNIGFVYNDSGLTSGQTHYYAVAAVNAGGRGPWSDNMPVTLPSEAVSSPPSALNLDPYFKKFLPTDAISVAAAGDVDDAELYHAREVINSMLANRTDVIEAMDEFDRLIAIYNPDNDDCPGPGQVPFVSAGRGIFGFNKDCSEGVGTASEVPWARRLHILRAVAPLTLQYPAAGTVQCNYTLVHEVAHLIHNVFIVKSELEPKNLDSEIEKAYEKNKDKWKGTYAERNYREYWAEAVTAYFLPRHPRGSLAKVSDNGTLKDYDSRIAALVGKVFGDAELPATCTAGG